MDFNPVFDHKDLSEEFWKQNTHTHTHTPLNIYKSWLDMEGSQTEKENWKIEGNGERNQRLN